ncbi:hypothetical protein EJ03DRAFT_378430 [Teratosphaeria nubilosa]|uniref:Uncharacterized protein n=1 Tax=Teratosphaeria nubilosa TaxID=161662 RepID=A0A6G1KWW9_9PEZI|nr:hypothetical protein EJ03DRAFT_378430 [Teratosphaeria nubilosa]
MHPSSYHPTPRPIGENTQDNLRNNYTWQNWDHPPWHPHHWSLPDKGPRRSAPAESPYIDWSPQTGWHRPTPQGPQKIPGGFKAKKFWARPSDGKRRGAMGRLKDVVTGEGPDVFVVLNADRRALGRDLPHRALWAGWGVDGDGGGVDRDRTGAEGWWWEAPWVAGGRGRRYNFCTRRYEGVEERKRSRKEGRLWADARWAPGVAVARGDMEPECVRGEKGEWVTRVPGWAGRFAGGRPYGFE